MARPDAFHRDWLRAGWREPGVASVMTTRQGGVSRGPWESMNLGAAVGDDLAHVERNRALFIEAIGTKPVFMKQVHGTTVVRLTPEHTGGLTLEADACITTEPGIACTVQVADCLPVLFAAPGVVGAAHAGWRGLAGGVLEATLAALCEAGSCQPKDVQCWLGACIGPESFEVGADVLSQFDSARSERELPVRPGPELPVRPELVEALRSAPSLSFDKLRTNGESAQRFKPLKPGKWLANLPLLARDRLTQSGVAQIEGGTWCTVQQASRFFSFRRDRITGRMAAAIWRTG